MDVTEMKKLMEILDTTDVTEIVLEADGTKISLKKDMTSAKKTKPAVAQPVENKAIEQKEEVNETRTLYSLNVGRFYHYEGIEVGTEIKENQKLGYIEAIGIKTDMKSDKDGKIKEILVDNGGTVEFGQPVIILE